MSNEARSHSHRWLVSPDRIVRIEDSHVIARGDLVRQRLSIPIKDGWRAATWDDLDPNDPATADAFAYKSEQESKAPTPALVPMVVYADGVPDATPVHVLRSDAAPDATEVLESVEIDTTEDGEEIEEI